MPYIFDGRPLIRDAFERQYTIPAFNICSAEMLRACIEAAEAERAPVIVQTYPADIAQVDVHHMYALVKSYADRASVPVMLHMDHGEDIAMDLRCLRAGYSSVMLDGANSSLDEVLEQTNTLADICHTSQASLEVAAESFNHGMAEFTKPADALAIKEAGADMIAISVGSEHGQSGVLQRQLMAEIANTTQHPLVLHGGSGISAEDYAFARTCGVVKANIGSALYRTLRGVWQDSADAPNHRAVYARVREALVPVARRYLVMMDASDKAPKISP